MTTLLNCQPQTNLSTQATAASLFITQILHSVEFSCDQQSQQLLQCIRVYIMHNKDILENQI